MSYVVLARKWRPQRFGDLVGQDHVVRALGNALASGRVGHAFLFSGARGVGKTTVGRLLAKGLNCAEGPTSEPCGVCSACRTIEEGRFVDLIEVDAASRTRVDDTRELLDNVQYLPSEGRYKVYLVDEVHMLSNHSFNALLKTLEEPPDHVKFVLATTEPARVPVTILSRCLQFDLKRIPTAAIRDYLAGILEREAVPTDPEAVGLVARAAEGSLRDGLSLLDQAINHGGGRVDAEVVRQMLGAVSRDRVLALLEAVAARDGAGTLDRLADVRAAGVDPDSALAELVGLLHRVAVMQVVPDRTAEEADLEAEEQERLARVAEMASPEDVQLFYQIGIQGRADMAAAPDPGVGLEMTLLRMVAFDPFEGDAADGAEAGPEGREGAAGEAPPRPASAAGGGNRPESASPAQPSAAEAPAAAQSPAPSPTSAPNATAPTTNAQAGAGEGGDWSAVLARLEIGPSWRATLEHAVPRELAAERVRLAFPASQQLWIESERFREALASALEGYFGTRPRLAFENLDEAADAESPAAARERQAREAQEAARAAAEEDPAVRVLQDRHGAQLDEVRPDDGAEASSTTEDKP